MNSLGNKTALLLGTLALTLTAQAQTTASLKERLPLLSQGERRAAQVSSHSPHQQNGDVYHPLYVDSNGDEVIFDAIGSGCITNIWGTVLDPEGVLKFYFNGETEPSLQVGLVDLFKGVADGFSAPLLSYDRRGYYLEDSFAGCCFKPIPFEKSLKISLCGKSTFYHILYETYPQGSMPNKESFAERERELTECFTEPEPVDAERNVCSSFEKINPWQSVNLLNLKGESGAIETFTVEADSNANLLTDLQLMMIWDESSADGSVGSEGNYVYERSANSRFYQVNAPLGFFFATPYNLIELQTQPLSTELLDGNRVKFTCRFVMPFWRSARIALFNRSSNTYSNIDFKADISSTPYDIAETGYFATSYRIGKSVYGRDWTIARLIGRGNFVGVVQSCRNGHYCEGNEHFYIDGNHTPQINGTGTEDYYLGCFWPNLPYHTPFAGCVNDVRKEGGGDPNRFLVCLPTDYSVAAVYYRFHIEMPLPFISSFDALIQQGAENTVDSDYATLAYYYIQNEPMLRQTDFIDVSNPASMKQHDYRYTGEAEPIELTARYEGDLYQTRISDEGYFHTPESKISFSVVVDASNRGVILRRRSDQKTGCQRAEVFVNGVSAGEWYNPQSNDVLRWYDSEFAVSQSLTVGKERLKITLKTAGNGFSDFRYEIFTIKNQ